MRLWWLLLSTSLIGGAIVAASACGDDEPEGTGGAVPTGGSGGSGGAGGFGGYGGPQVLANDQHRPNRIKLDGDHVYWATQGQPRSDGGGGSGAGAGASGGAGGAGAGGSGGGGIEGTIIKVPKLGGTPTMLATAPIVTALTVDGTVVYWAAADDDTGSILVVSNDGGESDTVLSTTGWPADLAADDSNLYWTQVGIQGGVWRAAKPDPIGPDGGVGGAGGAGGAGTGPPTQLYAGSEFVTFLALDDDALYFSDTGFGTTIGAIGAIDLGTGNDELLVEELAWPWHLAVGPSDVYFATELDGTVRSVAKSGSGEDVLATEQDRPYGVAVDGEAVYWTNRATNPATGACEDAQGTVMTVSLSGGEPTELASGQACPYAIAVDEDSVYWVNYGLDEQPYSGSVMRVPKL